MSDPTTDNKAIDPFDGEDVVDIGEVIADGMAKAEIEDNRAMSWRERNAKAIENIKEATRVDCRISNFKTKVADSINERETPTGFKKLDEILDGGLHEGLYIIGAISSLGKTTFCLQIADQIAKNGNDVIYISLEQSEFELMGKSVSRYTKIIADEKNRPELAKSYQKVVDAKKQIKFTTAEHDNLKESIERYAGDVGEHLYFHERRRDGRFTLDDVREAVQMTLHFLNDGKPYENAKSYEKKVVVIVDYLQIITLPEESRDTDMQFVDRCVTQLKQLSRNFGIPVITISSFNRMNYNEPVNMTSFKQSGGIEYSSDVLIGLQLDGMDYSDDDTDEKKRNKRIRELKTRAENSVKKGESERVQVKVLKNRSGKRGDFVLDFNPTFSYFKEPEAVSTDSMPQTMSRAEIRKSRKDY